MCVGCCIVLGVWWDVMCVDILRSIEGVACVWCGIVSYSIGGVGVMCVGDGVCLLRSCIVLGVCVCLLGSYTVSGVCVCAGGCMRQEDNETLSHAWLVPPWLGTSLLLPKPQGLLPPPPPRRRSSRPSVAFLSDLDVGLGPAASSVPGSKRTGSQ